MVFDTMVLAYALLGVIPFRDDAAAALAKAPQVLVPDSFRAELTNVLWQWVKSRNVPLKRAIGLLHEAEALITEVVPATELTELALQLSVANNVAAYDTLFVILGVERQVKLVTYDEELLRKFPNVAISPAAYVHELK
ncbi:MAG: type II toxin-antitoxin system VapC family toxin [Candidatus Schekmanbacteria bacterium]|nr:type II toxin-antitoxin system VapC family toxin [Candidatus Schekmanbacteria bacterium]